jgi:enterochelin esterase-like enzyme
MFGAMSLEKEAIILTENHVLRSEFLERDVKVDFYLPVGVEKPEEMSLLLINDGQDLVKMNFESILSQLHEESAITPLLCVGIHCGTDRRNEYGTVNYLDYKGRGNKAAQYQKFIFEELLPFLRTTYMVPSFKDKSFCGFSLGGLSAIDISWNNPTEFTRVGVFSGSLWWRLVSQTDLEFDEEIHRIMHKQIREGDYYPWLRFFFETGVQDETADRNNNGVIDAIDDTLSLIGELIRKGYDAEKDIFYLELADGKHDVPTWGRAMPIFLKWGWGIDNGQLTIDNGQLIVDS